MRYVEYYQRSTQSICLSIRCERSEILDSEEHEARECGTSQRETRPRSGLPPDGHQGADQTRPPGPCLASGLLAARPQTQTKHQMLCQLRHLVVDISSSPKETSPRMLLARPG